MKHDEYSGSDTEGTKQGSVLGIYDSLRQLTVLKPLL